MRTSFERILTRIAELGCRAGERLINFTDATSGRAYFDASLVPWSRELESHWREIRAELDHLLESGVSLPAFQEVSPEQSPISDDDRWKTHFFQIFGTPIAENRRLCPHTAAALDGIPGLCNAMFSILMPGKLIPEHRGPYKGLLRYHLALRVPEPASSCWIEVNGERRHWCEGTSLMFDDTFAHSAANTSEGIRAVLFLDVPRSLPWPISLFNRLTIALIGATQLARRPLAYLNEPPPTAVPPGA